MPYAGMNRIYCSRVCSSSAQQKIWRPTIISAKMHPHDQMSIAAPYKDVALVVLISSGARYRSVTTYVCR